MKFVDCMKQWVLSTDHSSLAKNSSLSLSLLFIKLLMAHKNPVFYSYVYNCIVCLSIQIKQLELYTEKFWTAHPYTSLF